jgi:hypothetical protein
MKFCHLQVNGWNWRISSPVSQVQKVKSCMFSLICCNIMGHRSHLGEAVQGRDRARNINQKLE